MQLKMVNLIVLSLLIVGCKKPAEVPAPPRPALVVVAGKQVLNEGMVLIGEVKSRYESNLGFRIGGKIVERKVEIGQQVKKGQIIARLDATDTNLTAVAALADVRAAEASHALAQAEVERQRSLFNKKFISASALDLREAELKTSAARLQQVKAQAAVSNNQSRYTALIADGDGIVTQIRAEPGQVVSEGETIAQIVDMQKIEVLIAVPESHMADLKLGDAVTIRLWANQDKNVADRNIGDEDSLVSNTQKTYSGKVREIAPAANSATRAFDVRVSITDADDAIKFGMTAGVRFEKIDATDNIVIPYTALTKLNNKTSVWVIDNVKNNIGIALARAVVAGPFTEDGVKITQGLRAGELVVIAGVHTLTNGQKVKPMQETQFKGFSHE